MFGMSRREIRIALTLCALVLAGGCSQIMTFNQLTNLGRISSCILVAVALIAEIVGWLVRREWIAWLGPVCALLCLAIALAFTFAPPQEEPGWFVDTSLAWERFESARHRDVDVGE
jgi:hypothetical protein